MKTIVLDPGHGGHDPGAVGPTGLKESDVALAIAQGVHDRLHGVARVFLTRDKDSFLKLSERARVANELSADLFLSIHLNAANGRASGFEVFTTPGKTKADAFATNLFTAYDAAFPGWKARQDVSDGDPDKEARFTVLTKTHAPAALFEVQFIDNPEIEEWFRSADNIDLVVDALTDGILLCLGVGEPDSDPETPLPRDTILAEALELSEKTTNLIRKALLK